MALSAAAKHDRRMDEKILTITISWTGGNYCCGWQDPEGGMVVATDRNLESLKTGFAESLALHIEGCVADGDKLPLWLINGEYTLDFQLDTSALLRQAERFTTMAALSRACGINAKQLSHYASGIKHPRPAQRQRILDGLRLIGSQVMALR